MQPDPSLKSITIVVSRRLLFTWKVVVSDREDKRKGQTDCLHFETEFMARFPRARNVVFCRTVATAHDSPSSGVAQRAFLQYMTSVNRKLADVPGVVVRLTFIQRYSGMVLTPSTRRNFEASLKLTSGMNIEHST